MSVWESVEALRAYSYDSAHATVLRRRREWFERLEQPSLALWWVPAGTTPSVADGVDRLAYLEQHGPTVIAFTFKAPFEASVDGLALPASRRARPCSAG